jgi:hypothetical protein
MMLAPMMHVIMVNVSTLPKTAATIIPVLLMNVHMEIASAQPLSAMMTIHAQLMPA